MTTQMDPYVRVYYSILTDERFEHVYDDDVAFATWVRLLMVADGAYPAPTHLPGNVKRRALAKLVAAGLIDLLPRRLFRVHGLQAERLKRAEQGRHAADVRHHGKETADRLAAERARNARALKTQREVVAQDHENASPLGDERLRGDLAKTAPFERGPAAASSAPAVRQQSMSSADPVPRRDEHRQAKTSKDETRRPAAENDGSKTRDRQPTDDERIADLKRRLETVTDPNLRMGIEATIERLGGRHVAA
jgi:hypothetical protein